jgi:hypothetical protein
VAEAGADVAFGLGTNAGEGVFVLFGIVGAFAIFGDVAGSLGGASGSPVRDPGVARALHRVHVARRILLHRLVLHRLHARDAGLRRRRRRRRRRKPRPQRMGRRRRKLVDRHRTETGGRPLYGYRRACGLGLDLRHRARRLLEGSIVGVRVRDVVSPEISGGRHGRDVVVRRITHVTQCTGPPEMCLAARLSASFVDRRRRAR